jgi:hypothetical protein
VLRLLRGGGGDGAAAPSALHCVASTRFKDKPVFELVVGGQRVGTFLCSDAQERDAWITDVAATRLELEQRSERLALCEALKSAVAGASDPARYLDALALLPATGVRVPLWWVRHAVRSGGVGADSYDYRQIFKDLQRDTVEVRSIRVGSSGDEERVERFVPAAGDSALGGGEGRDDSGRWADTSTSRVISALARAVQLALREESGAHTRARGADASALGPGPGEEESNGAGAEEARVLRFVHDLLLACNRTASGGDSFSLIFSMFASLGVVHIMPLASAGSALSFRVGRAPWRHGARSEESRVVVRFELSSTFRVAPRDDPSATLTTVRADFKYEAFFDGPSEGSIEVTRIDVVQ